MRRVLTALFGTDGDSKALAAAMKIAKSNGGTVQAVHVSPDPYDQIPLIGDGMTPQLIEASIDSAREMGAQRAAKAKKYFDEAVAKAAPSDPDFASWTAIEGRAQSVLAHLARLSDICVIGGLNAKSDPSRHIVFEALLFTSGRPVLLVPEGYDGTVATRIAVAWNDTVESSRAVACARPLLRAATAVDVLTTISDGAEENDATELCSYLAGHDIAASPTVMEPEGRSVADGLLGRSKALGADLLVLGGYGHSRIGEIVFGGVTRDVLHSYDIPVLFAH